MEHIDDKLLEQFNNEQLEIASRITIDESININHLRYIAAVDVAYNEYAYGCAAIVYDRFTGHVIDKATLCGKISFPYISGYLSYREVGIEAETLSKLKKNYDVLLVDGNGYLHERRAGEAVVLGVVLDKIAVGISKKATRFDGLRIEEPATSAGSVGSVYCYDEEIGRAVRLHNKSKCIYVSVGNKLSLDSAVKLVKKLGDKDSFQTSVMRIVNIETHKLRAKMGEIADLVEKELA